MSESRVVITASADQAVSEFERLRVEGSGSLRQLSSLGGKLGGLIAGLVAGFSAAAIGDFVQGGIDAADAAGKVAQKAGLAVRDVAGLELAYELAGLGGEALVTSMAKLSKGIVDGSATFQLLGVSTKDASGQFRSTKDVMYDLADRFSGLEGGALKTKLAMDVFGKSGADLIPLLNGGSAGLKEMEEMAAKLGLTIEQSTVVNAEKFNDTVDLLKKGSEGVARGVAAELLPTLSALAGSFLTSMTSGDKLKKTADFLGTGLKILYSVAMGIVEVFTSVGKVIAGVAAIMTSSLTGAIDVLSKIADGDFKAAWAAAKAGAMEMGATAVVVAKDIGSSWMDTGKAIGDAWTGAASKAVDAQTDLLKAGRTANELDLERAGKDKAAAAAGLARKKSQDAFIAGLDKEVKSLGLSATEIKINEAMSLGLAGAKLDLVKALLATRDEFKLEEEAAKKSAAEHKKFLDGLTATTEQLVSEAKAQQENTARLGMSREALADLDVQRLLNLATQKDENAEIALGMDLNGDLAAHYRAQAQALRDRAAAMAGGAVKEMNQELVKQSEAAVKKYEDIFSKGFADMLNNGKDGWKSFTQSLVTTFKTTVADKIYKMFAEPFVTKVIANLIGVTGGAGVAGSASAAANAGGAAGSIAGMYDAAKGAYAAISSGFSGISTAVADTVQGVMYQSGMTSQIAGNGAFASGAGAVAGYAAGAAVGVYGGRALSNGYSAIGSGSGNTAVNIGTIAGAILGGPIGAAIGGLLGGAVNRLFGRKEKEVTSTTLSGSFGAGGFAGTTDQTWMQKGGIFRSDKSGIDKSAIDAATSKAFTDGYEALKSASIEFANVLGVSAEGVKGRAQSLSIALSKDAAANEKAVAEFFVGVGNQIALELVPSLATLAKSGESASATLQRIAGNYAFVDVALEAIGRTMGATGVASVAARERLVELSGGIESFGRGAAFFAENFLSEAERMAPAIASVRATMAGLGLSSVDTRDEFKNVVMGLDLTTATGAETYASLMKVQEAFAKVYPALALTGEAAKSSADALSERADLQTQLDELLMTSAGLRAKQRAGLDEGNRILFDQIQLAKDAHEAQTNAKASLGDLVGGLRGFGTSARALRDSLLMGTLSTLTPEQQYAEARRQLQRTEAAALAGDVTAQGNFAAAQTAFLSISQKVNGGDAQYDADFKKAIQTTDAIAAWTDGQIDVAQASLNVLNDQVAWLSTLNDSVRAMGQVAAPVRLMPQVMVGSPDYRAGGALTIEPLVAEMQALREEVSRLRTEQKSQTGDLIGSASQIASRSDKAIIQGVGAAVATRQTALNSAAVLE